MELLQTLLERVSAMSEYELLYYTFHILILYIVFSAILMIIRLGMNKSLALMSKPFTSSEMSDKKILILGDSTAVGTGASSPEDTIAGRMAKDHPRSQIINLATNGGRVVDIITQIAQVKDQQFDMVIISAGGNDVWHFTHISNLRKHLKQVLEETVSISNHHVIFLLHNMIGDAPVFPAFLQWILKRRGALVNRSIQEVANQVQVPVIELFTKDAQNPFLQYPDQVFARDGIHPNSRGYEMWYNRMWREMVNNGFRSENVHFEK